MLEAFYRDIKERTRGFVVCRGGVLFWAESAKHEQINRITLGLIYQLLSEKRGGEWVRALFQAVVPLSSSALPSFIRNDRFLTLYAEGRALSVALFKQLYETTERGRELEVFLPAFRVGSTPNAARYFDIKATPPGLLAKLFTRARLSKEPELLYQVQSDLHLIGAIGDREKRIFLTYAVLSHGATYRHLEGRVLLLPSPTQRGRMIPYRFKEHLIWEEVKTVSGVPLEEPESHPGIYLCQGTEIWPSQPSPLGTIFANLAKEGVATEPYAYAWRQIHKHLRLLKEATGSLPIVAGHSMGGALAAQIALHASPLIQKALAFNPPVVGERDYQHYKELPKKEQKKLFVYANLDDLPFWRIGEKVIGQVTIFLNGKRDRYRPIRIRERFLLIPALYKLVLNVIHTFPAHQNIYALSAHYLEVEVSQEEVELENEERLARPDHLFFFPRLHGPLRRWLNVWRRMKRGPRYVDYLKSQIEIVELHEEDLLQNPFFGSEEKLEELQVQKRLLEKMLSRVVRR